VKIRPVGTELFHADEWTCGHRDMIKLIVAFRNFTNAPKNYSLPHRTHCASIRKISRLILLREKIAAKKYLRNSFNINGKVFPLPARLWPRGWVEI